MKHLQPLHPPSLPLPAIDDGTSNTILIGETDGRVKKAKPA